MEKYPFNEDRAKKGEHVVDKEGWKFVFVNDDKKDWCPLEFKCLKTGYPVFVDHNGQWGDGTGRKIKLYMATPDAINK
jgi:hypothetical protein